MDHESCKKKHEAKNNAQDLFSTSAFCHKCSQTSVTYFFLALGRKQTDYNKPQQMINLSQRTLLENK